MAARTSLVDSANVTLTLVRAWTTGGTNGKRNKVKLYRFSVVNTGADTITVGGNTNKIKATDFGLVRVETCSDLLAYTTSTGVTTKIVPAVPNYDGSSINLADAANATAANQEGPADATILGSETGQITVEGV